MALDRNMRLPDLAQGGSVTMGELIDAIAAEVVAKVEQKVLADLRGMLAQAQVRPTNPQERA